MKFASKNRIELEKVLEHYNKTGIDSLKYKAACFLIGNMRYHYSLNNTQLDTFRRFVLDTVTTAQTYPNFKKEFGPMDEHYDITYDAKVIKANYLIRNIDFSFRLWEETPWGKKYSFDTFCEELLPYRVGNEPIEDWKEIYYKRYQAMLDTALYDRTIPLAAWRVLYDYLHNTTGKDILEWVFAYDWSSPNLGALTLLNLRYGSCQELTDMLTYVMRSVGIPGGIDMMVQHPDDSQRQHWWNYMRDSNGLCTAFDFYYTMDDPAQKMTCIHKCGVVYRKGFAIQSQSFFMKYRNRKVLIPSGLDDPFLKNVSNQYFYENPITLPAGKEYENGDVLYLSVFNNSTWIPISWDEVKDREVTFSYLEPNVLYQLTYFSREGKYKAEFCPFVQYKDGSVYYAKVEDTRK